MAGREPITPLNEGTSNQNTTKSIIVGHISALMELLKKTNNRDLIKPMLLDFNDVQDVSDEEIKVNMKGKEKVGDKDLSKPFKEVLKCPFTRRIIKFSSSGHKMPTKAKIYDGTGDPEDHVGRFVGIRNQGEWPMPVLYRMFQQTLDGKARARHVTKTQRKSQRSSGEPMKLFPILQKGGGWTIIYDRKKRSVTQSCPRVNSNKKKYRWGDWGNRMNGTNGCLMGTTFVDQSTYLLLERKIIMNHTYRRTIPTRSFTDREKPERSRPWIHCLGQESGWKLKDVHRLQERDVACPKDYYPQPESDSKIESVMGFPLKCFLNAYKGYHQVQKAEEDEEKTAFYTDQVENSLPFFETSNDITKANKRDYRWIEKAENVFQKLKKMILDLPVLKTPLSKKTLFIYMEALKEAVSAVLLVVRKGKQYPIHDAERNYAPLEKMALALRHVSRRLRRYFEAHPITVITDQPIKQILNKVDTSGLVLISPTKTEYTYALRLNFESTNNQAEYEAFLSGLRIIKKMGVQSMSINAKEYISCFKNFKIQNIPRNENQKADVFRKLASVAFNHLTKEILVKTLDVPSMDIEEINVVVEEEGETWMTPIINYLNRGVWPEDQNKARTLRMKICQYVMEEGVLFKKSYLMPMIRYVGPLQDNYVIREIHMGACNMHLKSRLVVAKVIRQWYYWPTMHWDAREEIRKWREKKGWVDELPNVLWAHRTSLKTSNEETPYSLMFGSEAVIPAEIGMPTHQTMMITKGEGNEEEIREGHGCDLPGSGFSFLLAVASFFTGSGKLFCQ
nr:reverse transcriptase domain-containing protein [Tanacetum cinerariifolium]